MIKLDEPEYDFNATLDECLEGITGNRGLRSKLTSSKAEMLLLENEYFDLAGSETLYTIRAVSGEDPIVVGSLKKSELQKLYETYFRNKKKSARKIYEELLNSSKEKCPFCGGIGVPENLDHFLPKASFPQFSVLPVNLVPSCRDCNMGSKGEAYATQGRDQVIQPYLDNAIYFDEQWIYAEYIDSLDGKPASFEYFVSPPDYWPADSKARAKKHFKDFGIAQKYSKHAGDNLDTTLSQIKNLQSLRLTDDQIKEAVLRPGIDNAPFVNHWRVGMFQALIAHFF